MATKWSLKGLALTSRPPEPTQTSLYTTSGGFLLLRLAPNSKPGPKSPCGENRTPSCLRPTNSVVSSVSSYVCLPSVHVCLFHPSPQDL